MRQRLSVRWFSVFKYAGLNLPLHPTSFTRCIYSPLSLYHHPINPPLFTMYRVETALLDFIHFFLIHLHHSFTFSLYELIDFVACSKDEVIRVSIHQM